MNWEQLLALTRYGDEQPRLRKDQDDTRLGFEVDYDRVIFSSAFRSLQDKTQVIPFSKTDFVHTRLTHSLEVSVVGRSLGRQVGKKIIEKYPYLQEDLGHHFNDFGAIVAAAALAHDIGNPPFGHAGEKAMGEFFLSGKGQRFKDQMTATQYQDLIKFEGNANGFKLLNETKNGNLNGLRLSYATLGAFTKYPKESLPHKPSNQISDKKFGFFQSEKQLFESVAKGLGLKKKGDALNIHYHRHPLTFLVEAADDICYTIIDFEDGINLGLIPEDKALEYLIQLVKKSINTNKYHSLTSVGSRLSYLRSLAINTLIQDAVRVFLENEEAILQGEFHHALLDFSVYAPQIKDIISISVEKVYQSQEVIEKEIVGYQVIHKLLEVFTEAIENKIKHAQNNYHELILKGFLQDFELPQAGEEAYDWLIRLTSHVAALSDSQALRMYQKLNAIRF
ncbi:dGTP triphosphohydrolase [Mesonia sediminis]|uniref:dGTP triphosphohydrolase n=1 Tax=Mesonia sediminis TaxID=1703946 RepID=A0ABW5SE99_9FLAO